MRSKRTLNARFIILIFHLNFSLTNTCAWQALAKHLHYDELENFQKLSFCVVHWLRLAVESDWSDFHTILSIKAIGRGSRSKNPCWAYLKDLNKGEQRLLTECQNQFSFKIYHILRYLMPNVSAPSIFVQISWNLHQMTTPYRVKKLREIFWKLAILATFEQKITLI